MFLKYFEFIFAPFRAVNNKILGVKNIKGNIQVDINRAKSMKARGAQFAGQANAGINKFAGQQVVGNQQAIGAGAVMQQQGGMPGGQPGMPGGQPQQAGGMPGGQPQGGGMPGMPPMPGQQQQQGGIRTKGFWVFKKKFCMQCEQELYKTWDSCPYCAQIAQQVVAAPAKMEKAKTQAFMMDQSGTGASTMQLLGWIIPLQGPQRGELFTLQPVTKIGTDPKSTIVLNDKFMSTNHAEIKAEGGLWILRDAGSTNGTYVNNKRVDKHELVDNDFIKFGSAMLKFKSL